jgi:hypothetical protein
MPVSRRLVSSAFSRACSQILWPPIARLSGDTLGAQQAPSLSNTCPLIKFRSAEPDLGRFFADCLSPVGTTRRAPSRRATCPNDLPAATAPSRRSSPARRTTTDPPAVSTDFGFDKSAAARPSGLACTSRMYRPTIDSQSSTLIESTSRKSHSA